MTADATTTSENEFFEMIEDATGADLDRMIKEIEAAQTEALLGWDVARLAIKLLDKSGAEDVNVLRARYPIPAGAPPDPVAKRIHDHVAALVMVPTRFKCWPRLSVA